MSLLARLRHDGIVDVVSSDVDDQRKALRQKWDIIVSSLAREDECDVFFDMWALFQRLSPTHALYLQPLFRTPEVLALLSGVARKCLILDRVVRGISGGTSGSGHMALAGTLGVGKTYIMRGCALVVAALCVHCVPVTFDFEGHGAAVNYTADTPAARGSLPPISLILQAASAIYIDGVTEADSRIGALSSELETADIDVADSSMSAVGTLLKSSIIPLLLLDEVNLCSFADDSTDPRSTRGRRVTAQLQRFGRQRNTYALISGSSLTFREQLFAKGKWSSSTSLSGSLFYVTDVTPLRDPALLRLYTKTMFPPYGGDAAAADMAPWQRLLSLSGGVGRAIEAVMGGSTPWPRYLPAKLMADPYLRIVLNEMLGHPYNAEQLEAEWPLCVRVSEAHIFNTLTRLGCLDVADRILKWRDDGVLYANGAYLELLFPHVIKSFKALLQENYANVILVQYQLAGIDGSPGAVAEGLFRPGIRRIFPVMPRPSFKGGALVTQHREQLYKTPAGKSSEFVVSEHLGELVSWKAQVGLEDFMLQTLDSVDSDESDDEAASAAGAGAGSGPVSDLALSAWQCKAPRVGTITTWNDYDAAVASVVAMRSVKVLEPIRYLDHAIVKAQWGMVLLAAKLQDSESRTRVYPSLLFLTTTAVLNSTCVRKIDKPFPFPADLLRAACGYHVTRKGMTPDAVSAASAQLYSSLVHVERSMLRVAFVDGVAWTDDVSDELLGLFNTPVNRAKVEEARGGEGAAVKPTIHLTVPVRLLYALQPQ